MESKIEESDVLREKYPFYYHANDKHQLDVMKKEINKLRSMLGRDPIDEKQ